MISIFTALKSFIYQHIRLNTEKKPLIVISFIPSYLYNNLTGFLFSDINH